MRTFDETVESPGPVYGSCRSLGSDRNRWRFIRIHLVHAAFLLLGPGAQSVLCQNTPETTAGRTNSLRIQWGMHFLAQQDQLLSPLVYKDASPTNIGMTYYHTGRRAKNLVALLFDRFSPTSQDAYRFVRAGRPQRVFPTQTTLVNLRYGHARALGGHAFFAGLMLDNRVTAGEQGYGGLSTFNYLGSFSLSPWVTCDRALGDRLNLSFQIWAPILSWVTRSPYALNDDEYMRDNLNHEGLQTFFNYVAGGKLYTLNRWQKLNLSAELAYELSHRIGITATYQLEALRFSIPRSLLSYQQGVNIGFRYAF